MKNALKKIDDPDRPPLNKYMPSYEDPTRNPELAGFPLKLQTAHTRYAFHVMGDDLGSSVNDIREHRVFKDGRYYLVARISRADAEARGVKDEREAWPRPDPHLEPPRLDRLRGPGHRTPPAGGGEHLHRVGPI